MIEYTDECVSCHREMGCLGSSCPNKNVPHLYCDDCEEEVEDLYDYAGEQLCEECLLKRFDKVEV